MQSLGVLVQLLFQFVSNLFSYFLHRPSLFFFLKDTKKFFLKDSFLMVRWRKMVDFTGPYHSVVDILTFSDYFLITSMIEPMISCLS